MRLVTMEDQPLSRMQWLLGCAGIAVLAGYTACCCTVSHIPAKQHALHGCAQPCSSLLDQMRQSVYYGRRCYVKVHSLTS